ncbi:MAG: SIS domain-containing protein [Chloroflexota bacterium]
MDEIPAFHARQPNRDELFLEDILNAPAELAAVVAAQRYVTARLRWPAASFRRRRLIGMGSSCFAARDAAARWRLEGLDAVAEIASASGPSAGGDDTLAIAISSSGRTPEVIAAAERHLAQGSKVIAMTANARSPLAALTSEVIPLREISDETAGIASQTYRATVSGLLLLDTQRTADEASAAASRAPNQLAALLDRADAWQVAAADLLDTGRELHVLADGFHAGLAEQGALMFREASRILAMPFDTGDWLHVGQYTLFPGDGVLLFSGSPADDEAIATIHRRGGRVVVVGPAREGADLSIPVADDPEDWAVSILTASAVPEMVAAEIWSRADATAKGEGPGA